MSGPTDFILVNKYLLNLFFTIVFLFLSTFCTPDWVQCRSGIHNRWRKVCQQAIIRWATVASIEAAAVAYLAVVVLGPA